MRNKSAIIIFSLAVGISILAGLFFFIMRIPESTMSEPVERPYNRTSERPPSAVLDETSHPDLVDGIPTDQQSIGEAGDTE